MYDPINKKTRNNLSHRQEAIPPFEQELENDDHIEIQAETIESKLIKNILFVDDEESVCKVFKEALERFGYKVTVASNGNEGMALFQENPADLIITDIFMPEKNGHDFIFEIMQEFPEARILAITGKNTFMGIETELDIAQTLGAIRGFTKPVQLSELLGVIKKL